MFTGRRLVMGFIGWSVSRTCKKKPAQCGLLLACCRLNAKRQGFLLQGDISEEVEIIRSSNTVELGALLASITHAGRRTGCGHTWAGGFDEHPNRLSVSSAALKVFDLFAGIVQLSSVFCVKCGGLVGASVLFGNDQAGSF